MTSSNAEGGESPDAVERTTGDPPFSLLTRRDETPPPLAAAAGNGHVGLLKATLALVVAALLVGLAARLARPRQIVYRALAPAVATVARCDAVVAQARAAATAAGARAAHRAADEHLSLQVSLWHTRAQLRETVRALERAQAGALFADRRVADDQAAATDVGDSAAPVDAGANAASAQLQHEAAADGVRVVGSVRRRANLSYEEFYRGPQQNHHSALLAPAPKYTVNVRVTLSLR